MNFSLDHRTAQLGVGEFSDFTVGPRDGGDGAAGLWRAQLGTQWHRQLRAQAEGIHPGAEFERVIDGVIVHRGWTLTFSGRIDQLFRADERLTLREIKTVTRSLPESEAALRADYPGYFIQLATYAALFGLRPDSGSPGPDRLSPELLFVEAGSGLAQTVALGPADEALFRVQLDRIAEFLDLRLRARERLRHLRFVPPFASLRPGQETVQAQLQSAITGRNSAILFEAPTGFGKTGVLLELALNQLRTGHFDRVIFLTSKSTGQLQVVQTLGAMAGRGVAAWQVRAKAEHCVNHTFHCVRAGCAYLDEMEARWPESGLARFYLFDDQARDLETLRAAGLAARICPYEITRAALAFNDVWIGDYNYVFAPSNRSLFFSQPGFDPGRTLLIVDEAHNLASRVADAYSHSFAAVDAFAVREAFDRARPAATFVLAWEEWAHFLRRLEPADKLDAALEEEARSHLSRLAGMIATLPVDPVALGPQTTEVLWQIPALNDQRDGPDLPSLWWCRRAGELSVTCLDAAPAIGATLREFGGVVLATATPGPADAFARAVGLDDPGSLLRPAGRDYGGQVQPMLSPMVANDRLGTLTKRQTRKLSKQVTSAATLLRVEEERASAALFHLQASTPWREGAYDVACDVRVDTSFRQRGQYQAVTAATEKALGSIRGQVDDIAVASRDSNIIDLTPCGTAVFFPSYAYAEAIVAELGQNAPGFRASLQPRLSGLAAQAAWIEESLASADALFLVLGSSFAESIDLLGGRVTRAIVVGPALPEVNAVQKARLDALASEGRETAFRRVYQIPGMQKVNQALGRLVRAPGQHAKVLLHCRRFAEPAYAALLAPDLRATRRIESDEDLADWLK